MKIAFFGHSDFCEGTKYKEKMITTIESLVENKTVEFYLGNYGGFDKFCYNCCREYKTKNEKSSLVFVTPYIDSGYHARLKSASESYDLIIYPEIESKPKRFAIVYRNRFMVESADVIICYIKRNRGGAYQAVKYAKRLGRTIINLAEII